MPPSSSPLIVIVALLALATVAGFVLAIPWLRTQPDADVWRWTTVAAVMVLAEGAILSDLLRKRGK